MFESDERPSRLRGLAIAGFAVALLVPATGAASDCMTLELPDGQDRAEHREEIDLVAAIEFLTGGEFDPGQGVTGCVNFRNRGRDHSIVEAAIIVVHPALGTAPDIVRLHVDGMNAGRMYREVLPERRVGRNFRLTLHPETAGPSPGPGLTEMYRQVEVILMMERVSGRCTMSARVSGDATGYFFGDVAYINDLENAPVKQGMAAGSLADPDSQEMMGDFIEGMEQMVLKVREMGYETPGIDENSNLSGGAREEFAAFIEEELRAGDNEPGDDFGLSLADVKFDGNPDKSLAAAAALFGNAFTLNLSGSTRSEHSPVGGVIKYVDPSSITATVGLGDEGDTIPFVLAFGASPTIEINFSNEDYAFGSIVTRLETEDTYTIPGISSPRKLQIHVNARFVARKGALGCMR